MNTKIFKMPDDSKVMVMETEEFVEYYLQISSSDWHFCVGCKENFDDVTETDAMCIWDEYRDLVNEDEEALETFHDGGFEYKLTEDEPKPAIFRKELIWLMVRSVTTNLELCVCTYKETKQFCEMLMDKLNEAYKKNDIDEVDKLLGMAQKVLLEHNII